MHSPNTTTCNHHSPNAIPIQAPADYDICSNPNQSLCHPDSIINNFPSSPHTFSEFDHIYLQFLDLYNYHQNPLPPSSYHNEIITPPTPPNNIMMPLENNSDNANTIICSNISNKVEYNLAAKTTTKFRSTKKDRHSKINTANGPRDRRMRLSLDVARKFFRLQDLLGFDKASRTVDWLIKNSDLAIRHLARSRPGAAADLQDAVGNNSASSTSEEGAAAAASSCKELPKLPTGKKAKKRATRCSREAGRVRRATVGRESRRKARERARERTSQKRRLMCEESNRAQHPKLPFADLSQKESSNDDPSCQRPSAPLYGFQPFEHQNMEPYFSLICNKPREACNVLNE